MWKFSKNGMVPGLKADVQDVCDVLKLRTKYKLVVEVEVEVEDMNAFVA